MNLTSIREISLNFFLLSLLSFFGYLVAREFLPLAYPGMVEKLIWLSFAFGIFTGIIYSPTIYLVVQRMLPKISLIRHHGKLARVLGSETENAARVRLSWVFQTLLVSFLLVILIRQYIPFAEVINAGYLLPTVIFFGILSFVYPPGENVFKKSRPVRFDYCLAAFLGIAGMILVWYKVQTMGQLGYIIPIVSGLLIILLSILVLEED
ncbi:MAG: hypothetical protein JW727_02005 [Candidatus Aenigmarchaeota archaeon]|nr:hypothetical protein [Candidatus Aenigmarchaeota archaeon]